MRVVKTIKQLRRAVKAIRLKGRKIGFVPTMGYFHAGHLSLMAKAKRECGACVVSIYVNPKQFAPHEDLGRYPRDLRRDSTLAEKENVDILFIPSDNVVYPKSFLTYIDVEKISRTLCGQYRPGHFRGVATVVAKLLNMATPDVMYLGQKDAQQAAVLKTMAADLDFPLTVRVMPTVREKDGLAMSSRNVYLTARERAQAPVLYRSLNLARARIQKGERSAAGIIRFIRKNIARHTEGKIQYVACVDADTLGPLKILKGRVLIALSVFFGSTRLIDNVIIPVKKPREVQN
ncbi:MAG: pantoate--beta-alanine ligase [Candidatus Omnitrophica bacterium]|nr:pantoate--beta-alanine ligase [Candidatus Omnitrophota bacterium]MDE2214184.1 pantoate--beta-alanine ligase [Candidatus Omnitrophota bacterium]